MEMEKYFECNLYKDDIDNFINLYHFSRKEKQYKSGKTASPSKQRYNIAKNFESRKLTPETRAFLMYLHLTRQQQQQINRDDIKENEVLSPQEKGYNKYINSIAYKKLNEVQTEYGVKYIEDYKNGIDVDWDEVQTKINIYYKKRFPN